MLTFNTQEEFDEAVMAVIRENLKISITERNGEVSVSLRRMYGKAFTEDEANVGGSKYYNDY